MWQHGEDQPPPKAWPTGMATGGRGVARRAPVLRSNPIYGGWKDGRLRRSSAWLRHRCPARKRGELHLRIRKVWLSPAPQLFYPIRFEETSVNTETVIHKVGQEKHDLAKDHGNDNTPDRNEKKRESPGEGRFTGAPPKTTSTLIPPVI